MRERRLRAEESGQGTVEWVGLVLVVSLLVSVFGALLGIGVPGAALGHTIGEKIVCAVGLSGSCGAERTRIAVAYGDELAALVAEHAPEVRYEPGMRALPVDFRSCREDACADGAEDGEISRSLDGEPVTAFVHVLDCRPGAALARPRGADCSVPRERNVYIQYWLYYPGSATGEGSTPLSGPIRDVSTALGHPSYHPDDWESFHIRIGAGGRAARASSHHGYGGGWVADHGGFFVAGGSHAGSMLPRDFRRWTPPAALRLVPIESLSVPDRRTRFAVTPPWRKKVWRDPEYEGTD